MTPLVALWLPILLSAVIVFVASSILHMATPWHKGDFLKLPSQDRIMETLRPFAIPPGDYMVPCPGDMKDLKSPEFLEKMQKGPVMILTVAPNGPPSMGRNLGQWFVHLLAVGLLAAYVTGRALPPGSHDLAVFRFAGATSFIAHAVGLWPASIWYRRSWLTTFKSTIDGLIYGLLTAGTFGWLWPK